MRTVFALCAVCLFVFFVPVVRSRSAYIARSPSAILYDQYNSPVSGISSQNFEAAYNQYDDAAADDFVVPVGEVWYVEQVDVDGSYSGAGPGPASSLNVVFYENTVSNLPGSTICSYTTGYANGPASGDFVIALPSSCVLGPGTYWVAVQANQNVESNGQWHWQNRTVQANSGAAWINPGGGFGLGCTNWGRRSTCAPTSTGPDQAFRLSGIVRTPTAAPVSVSGRVMAGGRPVNGATVQFQDQAGVSVYARTNIFGYYRIDGLKAGATYMAWVTSPRYKFEPRVVSLMEDVSTFDFAAR